MQIGIFTSVFERTNLARRLEAVRQLGLNCVQFDLGSAGVASMPDRIEPEFCDSIAAAFSAHGVTMAAINGTFNMNHPDLNVRREGLRRLHELALNCERLGTS